MKRHTQDYDFDEPNSGHEERFLNKLSSTSKKQRLSYPFWIASSICLLLMGGWFFTSNLKNIKTDTLATKCSNQKLIEVNYYYASLEQQKIEAVNELDSTVLSNEFKDFENILEQVCQDLETAPNDDRVIQTLVRHYKKKINTLDHIIKKLESVQQRQKQNHYESISM